MMKIKKMWVYFFTNQLSLSLIFNFFQLKYVLRCIIRLKISESIIFTGNKTMNNCSNREKLFFHFQTDFLTFLRFKIVQIEN